MYKSDFLNEIKSRGFIYQTSDIDALDEILSKKSVTGYIGFDPTSDSLHIGSLVQLMLLNWLEHYGHQPIALMGGGLLNSRLNCRGNSGDGELAVASLPSSALPRV